jgi:hypothetical protein
MRQNKDLQDFILFFAFGTTVLAGPADELKLNLNVFGA